MNMQHSDLFFFLTAICLCIFDAPRVSSLLRRTPSCKQSHKSKVNPTGIIHETRSVSRIAITQHQIPEPACASDILEISLKGGLFAPNEKEALLKIMPALS